MPTMSFQPILDAALADYSKQIGLDLATHPLADSLRSCGSPDDVLKLLEDKANQFKDFRDGNRKLINWLSPVVQVVHTLSAVLGASITLVSRNILVLFINFFSPMLLPGSVRTSKGDICWRGCSHRSTYPITCSNYIASSYLDATGSQWRQLELRCARRFVRMSRKFPQTPSNLRRSPLDSFDEGDKRKDNGRVTLRACSRYQTD